nr:SdpI family protein [uncultured Caproiciproducens sp.]
MKNKFGKYIYWMIAVFPIILSAAFYSRLPEVMPTHWDISGNPNGYSPRFFAAFGIPAILLVCTVLVNFSISADPNKQNIDRSPQMKFISKWLIVIIANVAQGAVIAKAIHQNFNISILITVLVGIVIVVFGNYLPKCKPNYTIGIKLPWTLASEDNWRKTHRFAGFVWIIGGILIAVSAFVATKWLMIGTIILLTVIPTVYSYCIYQKDKS